VLFFFGARQNKEFVVKDLTNIMPVSVQKVQ